MLDVVYILHVLAQDGLLTFIIYVTKRDDTSFSPQPSGRHSLPTHTDRTKSASHLVGKADSVMIEDYTNEEVFLNNLKSR